MSLFTKEQLHQIRTYFENANRQEEVGLWEGRSGDTLQNDLVNALNDNAPEDAEARRLAYWALSKRADAALIPSFRNWLSQELKGNDAQAIFQLMIGLDNLEEPIFDVSRSGYASFEEELNRRDASRYLNQTDL